MIQNMEFHWLHLAATNPSPAFWESLATVPDVTVFKETDNDQNAETLLSRVLDAPVPSGVMRIAFLHVNDVTGIRGEIPPELIDQTSDRLTVLFTKGDPDYNSDPPVLHYSRDVLPFLESELLDVLRNDSPSGVIETLSQWLDTFTGVKGAGTSPQHAIALPEAHHKMITSQIHSASGRVSASLRRIRSMQSSQFSEGLSGQSANSWGAIIRSLEEAREFMDSVQKSLREVQIPPHREGKE
jgi:hypothetical protein